MEGKKHEGHAFINDKADGALGRILFSSQPEALSRLEASQEKSTGEE